MSAEDRAFRATFSLHEFNKSNGTYQAPPQPAAPPPPATPTINLDLMRENLRKEGFDFMIFPIGEKPANPGGYAISREAKITELEEENGKLRNRAVIAEETAATAIREISGLKSEIETLSAKRSKSTKQETT